MGFNNNIYKVNWLKLVAWLLPTKLLKTKQYAWCLALVYPIVDLHSRLTFLRKTTIEEALITGQVCVLQSTLNRLYDETFKRIKILKGYGGNVMYVYKAVEGKPQYLPQYLHEDGADFMVEIPTVLQPKTQEIRTIIDRYKLPTKTYFIYYV